MVCFTGCVTSKIEYTEKNELPKDKVYRISEVYMKDGSTIDMRGKEPEFKLRHKGIENVIVYYDESNKEHYIPLKDVNNLRLEILESNVLVTVIIIVGSLVLTVLILMAIFPFKGNITG